METVLSLGAGAAALNYGFGAVEGADNIRTLVAIGKGLAWTPCLANFASSANALIKKFHQSMEELIKAFEENNLNSILLNADAVQKKLDLLLGDRANYKKNFRGWKYELKQLFTHWKKSAYNKSWDEYLKPLNALNSQLKKLKSHKDCGMSYDLDDLSEPLRLAHNFINIEVNAHTGVAVKLAKKIVKGIGNAVVDKVNDLRGAHISTKKVQMPLSPLLKLMDKIGNFRIDPSYFPFMIEKELQIELIALSKSNLFFTDLAQFVEEKNPLKEPLIEVIDKLITDYILSKALKNEESFNRLCDTVKQFNPDQFSNIVAKDFSCNQCEYKLVWQAMAYVLDCDKITVLKKSLEVVETATLSDLAEKIDCLVGLLAAIEHLPDQQKQMKDLIKHIPIFAKATFDRAYNDLAPLERVEFNQAMHKVSSFLNPSHGNYIQALYELKKLYHSGVVAKLAVQSNKQISPEPKLKQLAQSMEEKNNAVLDLANRERDQELINKKKNALIETITFFSVFKVVDKYCAYKKEDATEEAFQRRYKKIYANLEGIEQPAERKKLFIKLLHDKIQNQQNLSFFRRWFGKKLSSFIAALVEHFTKNLTNEAMKHVEQMLFDTIDRPLQNNHMAPLIAANNGILSLLFAENQWEKDEIGMLGIERKEVKIHAIIEKQKDVDIEKIMQQFAQSAIDHSLKYTSNKKFLNGLKNRVQRLGEIKGNIFKRSLPLLISALGKLTLAFITAPTWIVHNTTIFLAKKGGYLMLKHLDLANVTVKNVRNAVYNDQRYFQEFDKVLLTQLKEAEKLLAEKKEDSEIKPLAGDKEKRFVEELVHNLFKVIDKRCALSPGEKKTRDNLLVELSDALNNGTDHVIKSVMRDIIIVSYEAIRNDKGINGLLGSVLDQATASLKPSNPSKLWELFTVEELEDLGVDKNNPDDLQKLEIEFARRLGKFDLDGRPDPEAIIQKDIDQELQKLYSKREGEIHKTLERILKTQIETVVKCQVDAILMTPNEAIEQVIITLENELIPHIGIKQTNTGYTSYIDKMHEYLQEENIEEMKKIHIEFMHKLQGQLKEMNQRKGSDLHSDLQMQMIERLIADLTTRFAALTESLEQQDSAEIHRELLKLKELVATKEHYLNIIRYNINKQEEGEKTFMDHASLWTKRFIRWGVENISPVIRDYVTSRLKPRIEGVIDMAKDPNAFTAFTRAGAKQYTRHNREEQDENNNSFRKVAQNRLPDFV